MSRPIDRDASLDVRAVEVVQLVPPNWRQGAHDVVALESELSDKGKRGDQ
jgi:hypothetical protein